MTEVIYRNVAFELADRPDSPLHIVLGVRKSGSSVLNSIVEALAACTNFAFVDVAGTLFRRGVSVGEWQTDHGLASLLLGGNVLGGFRDFPAGMSTGHAWNGARKILLVRDPRDALVSEFFSNAFSHQIPDTGKSREEMMALRKSALETPIEQYVTDRAMLMVTTMSQYLPLLEDASAMVFKYEDFIPDKRTGIGRICSHFGWQVAPLDVEAILSWADVQPDTENPGNFIRKVTPGDHRDKLTPAVIEQLNEVLGPVMRRYGYPVEA